MDSKIIIFFISIITLINFYLGISFLLKLQSRKFYAKVLILLLLIISIWSFGILGFHFIKIINRIVWIKITHISGMLIPFLFLLFCLNYPNELIKKPIINIILIIPIIVNFLLTLFSNRVIGKVIDIRYEIGDLYIYYALVIICYFLMSFFSLLNQLKKIINDNKLKAQIYLILLGAFFSSIGVLIFDLILPYFQVFKYTWIGPLILSIWILLLGISLLKFSFLDFKVISTELITFLLWSILIVRFLLSTTYIEYIVNLIILMLLILLGIFLINSVIKEVNQREQLAELNKKLEYQYNLRGKILSIISHQVRAPLTNIREFVRFLIEGEYGQLPEKSLNILKRVDRNVKEELSLINDLGDFRRLEEGHFEYQFNSFNLLEIIKDTYEIYKSLANEKNLEFKIEIDYRQLSIYGDKEKLRQVLINLVDNAIKYTDQGWVKIGLEKKDNEILITVADTGQGINKENLETIFNEFITMEGKKKILGTGLGLYLSKKIVEAHNGKIWAESEGEGKGSVFYIKLPIKA